MAAVFRRTFGKASAIIWMMNIIFLGIGIGMLSLIAPGPVNLTLLQVGARLGRRPALRGAVGIAGGDSALGLVAVAIVGLGAALPSQVFTTTQVLAALLLATIGGLLIARPGVANTSLDRMQRPGRTFFVLTSCTPTALGGWIVLLAAMPFAADTRQLTLFTLGVLVASFVWHPILGVIASALGHRLTEQGQLRLSRAGGAGMAILGISLAVRSLS